MKKEPDIERIESKVLIAHNRNYNRRNLITIFWIIAVVFGAIHAWVDRYEMTPDGISYLDMSDAYLRGDWSMAINSYWSPFYSWLLGLANHLLRPSPYWEFPVVHLVNFVIYLCALGCFQFFLLELSRCNQKLAAKVSGNGGMILPEWALLVLGYTLFIYSSLQLISISLVTPDMCVAAFVYLVFGILLRIKMGFRSRFTFVILGILLGFSYLAKQIMFPLAFIFLGISVFLVGNFRKAIPRVLIAILSFFLVSTPYIIALSNAKGHLTIGDAGRLNYIWKTNGFIASFHWQEEQTFRNIIKYPLRKISDTPKIYEFGFPIRGTYPLWYDPSYWSEGLVLRFHLRQQLNFLVCNIKFYLKLFFREQIVLICGLFILYFMGRRRWLCVKDISEYWNLFIPTIIIFAIYSLVHVSPRYIGAFVVILWVGLFSGVRLPDTQESKRLMKCVVFTMLLQMIILPSFQTATKSLHVFREVIKGEDASGYEQYRIANGLKQMGVKPTDKVALFGNTWNIWSAYWARLARVKIVAAIPDEEDSDNFWMGDTSVRSKVIKTLGEIGVKFIVAKVPRYVSTIGWQRIGNTDYHVLSLSSK